MKRGHRFWLVMLIVLLAAHVALAALSSTIVLLVEGMT